MQAVTGFGGINLSFLFYSLLLWSQHGFMGTVADECIDTASGNTVLYHPREALCCSGRVHTRRGSNTECCGSSVFNSSVEVCCDGHISQNSKGNRTKPVCTAQGADECCGREAYDPSLSTCCSYDGIQSVHDGIGDCCGSFGFFDPSHRVCCYSFIGNEFKLSLRPSDTTDWQCCGSDLYDPGHETCCHETIFQGAQDCCGPKPYSSSKELCCEGSIHIKSNEEDACCGRATYSNREATCCSGELFDIANGSCCWGTAYDPLTSSCCGYVVNSSLPEIPDVQGCCGSQTHLTTEEICCQANGSCCWGTAYDPLTSSCCGYVVNSSLPEIPDVQGCCGSQTYLTTEEICCQGQLYGRHENSQCCEDVVYDTSTHICCGEWSDVVVLERTSDSTSCCGQTTFEEDRETCCHYSGQVFPIIGGQCCMMPGEHEEAFDPNQGICCSDMFGEIFYPGYPTHQYECCGSHLLGLRELCDPISLQPVAKTSYNDDAVCTGLASESPETYNSISNVCVAGLVIPLAPSQGICGNQLMDRATEICCLNMMIHARYDGGKMERKCCEDSLFAYSPRDQSCCLGIIYDIPEKEARCCHYQAYHKATEVCEEDGYIRPKGKPHRCGDQYYNMEENYCCGDAVLLGPGYTCCDGVSHYTGTDGANNGECCGGIGYNPGTHVCCGAEIHPRTEQDSECCGNNAITPEQAQNHICCEGVLQPTHHNRKHCHGQLAFNPELETVCGGSRYPVPGGACCGYNLYNPSTKICCRGNTFAKNGSLSLMCCGAEAYDSSNPSLLCCDSVLHHNATEMGCCGTHSYDPRTQQCCHGPEQSLIYSSRGDHYQCCDHLLFNSSKHRCCSGVLHQFRAEFPCCGPDVLVLPRDICCQGHISKRLHGADTQCCGRDVYSAVTHACLDGMEIAPRWKATDQDGQTQKLGNVCLDPTSQVTFDLLTEAYSNHSTVAVIAPLRMKTRHGLGICKSRILRIMKPASSQGSLKGAGISFGSSCPCEHNRKASLLFTNQSMDTDRFVVGEGDFLFKMNKFTRQALKQLEVE